MSGASLWELLIAFVSEARGKVINIRASYDAEGVSEFQPRATPWESAKISNSKLRRSSLVVASGRELFQSSARSWTSTPRALPWAEIRERRRRLAIASHQLHP